MFGRTPHSSYHMPLNRSFFFVCTCTTICTTVSKCVTLSLRPFILYYKHFYTQAHVSLHSFFSWSCRSFSCSSYLNRDFFAAFFLFIFIRSTYRFNRFMHPFILIYCRWSKKEMKTKRHIHSTSSQKRTTCTTKTKLTALSRSKW